jgi:hypothetical protein
MTQVPQTYGILAEYESAHAIYEACKKVRDAGYQKWDACTPFPVHGLEKAMGLKASVLPWAVLVAGITGGVLMTIFMVWVAAYDYPLNIGGKPTWSLPAFVPPAFEMTILFAALTAVFGMFFLNRLPTLHHPLFNSKRFERVTDDRFFIVIETQDPQFEMTKTQKLLEDTGAVKLEILEH